MAKILNAKAVGEIIASRRKTLGLTQGELARRTGVSRQWVIAVEQGKPRAEFETIVRALSELDLAVFVEPDEDDNQLGLFAESFAKPRRDR